jgi:hypothetical protein
MKTGGAEGNNSKIFKQKFNFRISEVKEMNV